MFLLFLPQVVAVAVTDVVPVDATALTVTVVDDDVVFVVICTLAIVAVDFTVNY